MGRVGFVTHGNATILKVDLSHLANVEDSIATLKEARTLIAKQPPHSVCLLTDVTGAAFNPKGVEELKHYSAFVTPYVKASAAIGISGLGRVIFDAVLKLIGRNIASFATEAEALDWLGQQ